MNLKIADFGKLFLLLCACGRVTAQYGSPAAATNSYASWPASNPYSTPSLSSGGYGSNLTPAQSTYGFQSPWSYSIPSFTQVDPYAQQSYGSQASYSTPSYDPYSQSYGGNPAALAYQSYPSSPFGMSSYDPYAMSSYDPYAQMYGGYPVSSAFPGYSASPYMSSYDPYAQSYGLPTSYGGISPFGISPFGFGDSRGSTRGDLRGQSLLGGLTNMEDSNMNGIPDHLELTKSKIDDYLAKTQLLGNKKLSVSVNYLNTPLEYQYLNQYHGFGHPLSGTALGEFFGVPSMQVVPPPQPQQFVPPPQPTQFQTPPQQQPQQMREIPPPPTQTTTQSPNQPPRS